ncbi:hypothetical protein LINPERHAP2_LOCUS19183 [Linum perenne]
METGTAALSVDNGTSNLSAVIPEWFSEINSMWPGGQSSALASNNADYNTHIVLFLLAKGEKRREHACTAIKKVCASKWNERECAGIAIKELYGSAQDEEADAATALFVVASITIDVYSLINCPKIECNKVLSKGNYSIARVCIIIIFRLIS